MLISTKTFSKSLAYFSARFRDINRCFILHWDTPQKVDKTHWAVCFCAFLPFNLSQKFDLFRLSRIAVNAMTLVQFFPSCLVSNPIYRRSALFPVKLTIEFMEYYSHLPNMASTFWLASWATDSEPIRAREITVLVKSN